MADVSHHLNDDCPGGHRDDPYEASRLNDQLLDQEPLDPPAGGRLTDRQAALFAAITFNHHRRLGIWATQDVCETADDFHAWLTGQDPA